MIVTSSQFNAALTASHTVVSRVTVYSGGASTGRVLTPASGYVTADASNVVRRTCQITLNDPSVVPVLTSDPLAPYGNELFLERGIQFPDGTREYVPLGVFGITGTDVQDSGAGFLMTVDGSDRARKVQRAKFTDVYPVAAGTNVGTAIANIVTSRYAAATLNFAPASAVTAALVYDAGGDPWTAATDLAASIGYELFVDPTGVFVLRPVPNPYTAGISWTYAEGALSLLSKVDRKLDDSKTINYVIVTGENAGSKTTVPRAVAQDSNTASPTYTGGPYGMVVQAVVDRTVQTTADAQAAATAILNRSLGLTEEVDSEGVLHPGQEPSDVVLVTRARAGVSNARFSVDQVVIPLEPSSPIKMVLRRRT